MTPTPEGVYEADCLDFIRPLPPGGIDLVYVDPPFFSGRPRQGSGGAFDDSWAEPDAYLAWLLERLEASWRVLRPGGTLWVHLDHHAVHAVKVALDRLLGERAFRNEVIWCYNGGGVPRADFPRKHDNLLRYVKEGPATFHVLRRPFKANTRAVGRHSTYAREVTIDLESGTPYPDWWDDIPTVTGWSPERTGFPTQKPLALLRRIVSTTSRPGDLVADFFCGSGTTLVAAREMGRRHLGVDISREAVALARRRLSRSGTESGRREGLSSPPRAGL